jgi:tetratricopeptide (TPR) repeat protein
MTMALTEAPRAADEAATQVERLSMLERLNLGPVGYFVALTNQEDEIVAIGAANVLLDQSVAPESVWSRIIGLAKFQSVQLRAFDFFMSNYEYERARAVLETPLREGDRLIKRQLAAIYEVDAVEMLEIEIERFFRTGEVGPIANAAAAAETAGGWRKALPLLVDLVLINPQNSGWALRLGRTLREANRLDLLERYCDIIDKIEIFPNVSLILRVTLAVKTGDAKDALKQLEKIDFRKVPDESAVMVAALRAELFEKLGRFEDAFGAFLKQNKLLRSKEFRPGAFAERVRAKGAAAIAPLPPDERVNHFIMLGFPRSGTTLLENALASHPRIETFEEIQSFAAINHLFRPSHMEGQPLGPDFAAVARMHYYREMDRRKKKAHADIYVDKLPIISAEAKFLKKLLPQKRYVFSIRHPYDVVLSCFKQAFGPNIAMDNFTTFEDSCRVYDFTMNEWFSQFTLDSEEVCYIRYDRLVTDLKGEVSRVLAFLGAEWDENILQFAERAEAREVKTPSYAKVRAGLTIGVQSSWRNYEFLFRGKEARPLDRWVKFFGYETT